MASKEKKKNDKNEKKNQKKLDIIYYSILVAITTAINTNIAHIKQKILAFLYLAAFFLIFSISVLLSNPCAISCGDPISLYKSSMVST